MIKIVRQIYRVPLVLIVVIMAHYNLSKQTTPTVYDMKQSQKKYEPTKILENFRHLGDHIIAEFTGASNCNNIKELKIVLREAAEAAGATVLSVTTHQFEPYGMTGVAVLQESHISVHTWPEYGYVSIDVYTCGDHILIDKAIERLQEFFCPTGVTCASIKRGFYQSPDIIIK